MRGIRDVGVQRRHLHRLITAGESARWLSLVGDDPRLIDQRGGDGVTMLWTAARRGRLALVRWLVAEGADVEIPGSAVHVTQVIVSPYCIAVRSRRAEVAQYLLDHGAQVDVFCAAAR